MHRFLLTFALLTEVFVVAAGLAHSLNVTVLPGPTVHFWKGGNASLLCHVSQKKRQDSLLAMRWVYSRLQGREQIIIKMNKFGAVQRYGNYSHSRNKHRLNMREEQAGTSYRLLLSNLRNTDQGRYTCRVQEIGKQRSRWTAWSNGSGSTEMIVNSYRRKEASSPEKTYEAWELFEAQDYLVRHPRNSSGDTVTSVSSLSPLQPKKQRKQKPELPPALPAKAPVVDVPPGPRLLKKHQAGNIALPKIAEENLTYAELELMKPPPPAKGPPTSTVYAQILFEENTM